MIYLLIKFLFIIFFFFFNAPAPTEIYTLSLHDALPISERISLAAASGQVKRRLGSGAMIEFRSEEHTSELQSPMYLVCRLLLEKKKKKKKTKKIKREHTKTIKQHKNNQLITLHYSYKDT